MSSCSDERLRPRRLPEDELPDRPERELALRLLEPRLLAERDCACRPDEEELRERLEDVFLAMVISALIPEVKSPRAPDFGVNGERQGRRRRGTGTIAPPARRLYQSPRVRWHRADCGSRA
jgi:hypothetical protein